jgi:hypothetical protein
MVARTGQISTPGWTFSGSIPASVQPMAFIGRYRSARRAIDPPRIELSPVAAASRYEIAISPLTRPDLVLAAGSDIPAVDLAPVWDELPQGILELTGRAFDASGAVIGVTPLKSLVKAPDWIDHSPEPLDYFTTGAGVVRYLCEGVPAAPQHPGDPAYMWHAAMRPTGPDPAPNLQHPALSYPMLIGLFLAGHRLGLGDDLVDRATRLADFLVDHPMVSDGPLAGLPMSTLGHDGRGGLYEEDRTTLVRIGWTGRTMLDLAAVTGNDRYASYARSLGEILLATQAEDGSWPYRVRLTDGAVLEPYTAASVMALFLIERLATDAGDDPYRLAFDRGLAWTLDNPVQTGLWQQMYEDVRTLEPYDNLEQWAALETAMLLLRRGHPDALATAARLVRYVEDQFVLFGDEASLPVPYLPFVPSVMEQYHCYWPMDCHTANYVRATLALHEATGDPAWAHKAVAAANTIVACQRPDGRLSTLVPDRRFGTTPPFSDWFNCMALAADVLLTLGPRLTALAGKEAR